MIIAQEKRKTNIAEYIIYMWQIEDLLRACSFDREQINERLVKRFHADEETTRRIAEWYYNLALAMEKEHIQQKGHLQSLVNLVNDLNEFHLKLVQTQADQQYLHLYRMNRESIAEFYNRSDRAGLNEIEVCLNALYGVLLLKLKNAEISSSTQQTVAGFGQMIGHLSARYIQFEHDEFEF